MKILFVVNDPVFFLSHRLPIARAAKGGGFDVVVASPDETCVERIKAEGFDFFPLKLSKHGIGLFGELRTFLGVFMLLRALRPTLVHLVTIKPVIYGGIAARLINVPAVVSAVTGLGLLFVPSGGKNRLLRFVARQAYRLAFGHQNQAVVFQNPDDMGYCVASGLVARSKCVLIKGSGVDMAHFSPQSGEAEVSAVLLAGRMLWEKGVGDFVEAARLLKKRGVAARFILAGSSVPWNSSSVSDTQLKRWHDEGVVEWWGAREDMPAVFRQVAIVCLPSAYGEGVPKVLIEAAACGKPIVTTDSPGCREIVQHQKNGFLVPVGDVKALAAAIDDLLADDSLRLKFGAAGRQWAMAEFSQEQVVRQTLATYDRLLSCLS